MKTLNQEEVLQVSGGVIPIIIAVAKIVSSIGVIGGSAYVIGRSVYK